jgi:hypothetical protein
MPVEEANLDDAARDYAIPAGHVRQENTLVLADLGAAAQRE